MGRRSGVWMDGLVDEGLRCMGSIVFALKACFECCNINKPYTYRLMRVRGVEEDGST